MCYLRKIKKEVYSLKYSTLREKFLEITTLLDARNSKKSKRFLFIVPKLDRSCPMAGDLQLLLQLYFVTVANVAY